MLGVAALVCMKGIGALIGGLPKALDGYRTTQQVGGALDHRVGVRFCDVDLELLRDDQRKRVGPVQTNALTR
jgi:hypothetical protein